MVLLREVARDLFLRLLSWEHADVAALALYLRQAHMSVLPLSKEEDWMQKAVLTQL